MQIWLPGCPLSDWKTIEWLIKQSHMSTNPENLMKIRPVDSVIMGLIGGPQKLNKEKTQVKYTDSQETAN